MTRTSTTSSTACCDRGHDRLADRRQRQLEVDRVDLLGCRRHPPDHARRLVLTDREGADVAQHLQSGGTVTSHPGEQGRDRVLAGHLGDGAEGHVDAGHVVLARRRVGRARPESPGRTTRFWLAGAR